MGTTYMVCNAEGYAEADGLQEHEARMVAQRIANSKGEPVWLSESDSEEMGEEIAPEYTADDLVLCRSDRGDGGWSLHAPGSTDEAIASGDAPPLVSGEAEWDDEAGDWNRPDEDDYRQALIALAYRD